MSSTSSRTCDASPAVARRVVAARSTARPDDSAWLHRAPPTFAQQGWIHANGLTVLASGLPEAEVMPDLNKVFIVLTTFVVNLRHALYSASVAPYLKRLNSGWKMLLAYLLTDEAYAVAITHYAQGGNGTRKHWYFFGAGLTLWTSWQASTAVGILLGAQVPASWSLDFTLPLTFIAARGDPYTELTRVADEVRADAVIVGASAKAGHRWIGSLAVRLVKAGRGTPHGGAYLDVRHLGAEQVRKKLPSMVEQFHALASVDITPEYQNMVPSGSEWTIVRRWGNDLPLRDPPRIWRSSPMLLGRPPARRWNFLSARPGKFMRPAQRIVAARQVFRVHTALPVIDILGGVAVVGSRPMEAAVFDFGPVAGRLRLTNGFDGVTRAVKVRFANDRAEFQTIEGSVESFVFAPGERTIVDPQERRFRYAMVYGGNAAIDVVQ